MKRDEIFVKKINTKKNNSETNFRYLAATFCIVSRAKAVFTNIESSTRELLQRPLQNKKNEKKKKKEQEMTECANHR